MSPTALAASAAPRARLTTTERNWLLAVAISAGCVLLFRAIGELERSLLETSRAERLVWNASETSTRYLAIAHALVATLFLLTSRRMQAPRSWLWVGGLLAAGVALCWGFAQLGGKEAPLAGVLFYGYFMAHELRDEVFFYRSHGDHPVDPRTGAPMKGVWTAPLLLVGLILTIALAMVLFPVGAGARYDQLFEPLSQTARYILGVLALAAGAALFLRVVKGWERTFDGGWRGLIRCHRPMFVVFAGTFLVLTIGAALTGRIYAIIGVHVAIWYVFALRRLAKHPPSPTPRALSWRWMRTTPAGLSAVHLAALLLVLAGGAVWAFGFGNAESTPVFAAALSRDSFPYWTILHVTLSWIPR